MRAIRGLQTPQQTKTYSASIGPLSVWTRRTRPFSTSIPVTSVLGETVNAPSACAASRITRAGADRVDDADSGRVEAAEQDLLVDVRHELLHLRRRQQLRRLAPRDRRGKAPVQLLQALRTARDLDPAADRVDAELDVLVDRVARQRGDLLRVVDREDEVGRMARGAAGVRQRALVEQDEIAPAEPREVMHEAVADDAGADDDGLRAFGEGRHQSGDPTSCSSRRSSPSRRGREELVRIPLICCFEDIRGLVSRRTRHGSVAVPGAWGSAPAARLALPRARLRRFDRGDATVPGSGGERGSCRSSLKNAGRWHAAALGANASSSTAGGSEDGEPRTEWCSPQPPTRSARRASEDLRRKGLSV